MRLPAAAQAWRDGQLDSAHVDVLGAVGGARCVDAMTRDEAMLVEQARQLSFRHWRIALSYWEHLNDPDRADTAARRVHARRRFHLSETTDTWIADGTFDPVGGTIIANTLGQIGDELFAADWAEATERLGRRPIPSELTRTPAQRRADALVEMARRAMATPAGARRPDPCFTVLVDDKTLTGRICELAGGKPVAPGALLPWLTEAWVRRVVFDGPSRVVDVGVDRRLFTGATRIAVQARDRECYMGDLCDAPHRRLEVDHIVPYAAGGPTTTENGRLACSFHNRQRNGPPSVPP